MPRWTPPVDDAIRAAYAKPERGAVTRLASTLGVARMQLYRRAIALGVPMPRRGNWRDEEAAIIAMCEGRGIRFAARKLPRHPPEVVAKRLRWAHGTARRDDPDWYTPEDLGALMGVTERQIRRWCEAGKLKARVTHGPTLPRYDIHRRAVRDYLIEYAGHWDHRRVDPIWLVDLLARMRVRKAEG